MDCIGERILNAFCGAVAVYDEECKTFCFQYCPEKVVQLLGYDMPYFDLHFSKDALGLLCDEDRMEVEHAIMSAKSRHIGIKVYSPVKDFSTSAAELKLRYAPNEKFFQTQWNRFPVSLDAPVFTLSHTIAGKGVLGSDYTYNHTEAGIQKRFWFSAFGYTDIILKAGKVWDKVPFPLLIMPNANLSYTIQPESYSLMNAMEFMNDEYFSWDVTYFLNGGLFNRIPLLKKLKWREIVSCRGLYGHLSDKNNPELSDGLFAFPIADTRAMGKTPYVEVGVGIENIFKVLRLDYVWRLTYRDSPGIDKSGLRISLHMTF